MSEKTLAAIRARAARSRGEPVAVPKEPKRKVRSEKPESVDDVALPAEEVTESE